MNTPEHTPEPSPPAPAQPPSGRQRVRLTGSADLIATVPYLLGHTGLADDLVIVAQAWATVALTVRVDLAALSAGALWTSTARALANAGARTVHLIAYPSPPVTDVTLRGLHTELAAAYAAGPPGLAIDRVLTVSQDRWWSHDLASGAAPRGPGAIIVDNPGLTLHLALGYGVPAANRRQAIAVLDPHPEPVRVQVRHLLQGLPVTTRQQRSAVVDAAHAARVHRPIGWTLAEVAAVLDAVADLHVRDLALAHIGEEAGWWVWSTLLPYAPESWVAPVATLLAIAAHQRGDGVLANAAIARAQAADPAYSLAALFDQILTLGVTPTVVKDMIAGAVAELTHPGP